MTVTVHVTEEHIKRGQPRRPSYCPIALALREATGAARPSVVPLMGVWHWNHDLSSPDRKLPQVAAEFARDFDAGLPVRPISFDVEFPAE